MLPRDVISDEAVGRVPGLNPGPWDYNPNTPTTTPPRPSDYGPLSFCTLWSEGSPLLLDEFNTLTVIVRLHNTYAVDICNRQTLRRL